MSSLLQQVIGLLLKDQAEPVHPAVLALPSPVLAVLLQHAKQDPVTVDAASIDAELQTVPARLLVVQRVMQLLPSVDA